MPLNAPLSGSEENIPAHCRTHVPHILKSPDKTSAARTIPPDSLEILKLFKDILRARATLKKDFRHEGRAILSQCLCPMSTFFGKNDFRSTYLFHFSFQILLWL